MAQRDYFKPLDGLRGLAVMAVMLFHYKYFKGGWLGVQLFFVLSGFLITKSLLELKKKRLTLGSSLKIFYWKRVLRILPVYYLYLLMLVAVFLATGLPENFPSVYPYLFTHTVNFLELVNLKGSPAYTHLWSLSVEEQFYLIWPLVVLLIPTRALPRWLIAIVLATPLVRWGSLIVLSLAGYGREQSASAIYWFTLSHIDAFALGAFINFYDVDKPAVNPKRLLAIALSLFIASGAANLFLSGLNGWDLTTLGFPAKDFVHWWYPVWSYSVANLLFAALILSVVAHRMNTGLWRSFLEFKPLAYIGKISYGIYLYHWPIMALMVPHPPQGVLALLIYFAAVIAAASISYYAFERFFLRLKNRIPFRVIEKAKVEPV